MTPGRNNNEEIESYLLGGMKEEERIAFEKTLADNAPLREEVAFEQTLIEGVETYGASVLKSRLQQIHTEVHGEQTTTSGKARSLRWLIAVFALALLALLWWWTSREQVQTPQQIYAAHFQPYPFHLTQRSGDTDAPFDKVFEFYAAGQYDLALQEGTKALTEDANNHWLHLTLGMIHLKLGEGSKAMAYFQKMQINPDFLLLDASQWYTALAYLQQDQPKRALFILYQIVDDNNHDYQHEAQSVLKALQRLDQ